MEGGDYLMDHSANVVLMNPAGQYHAFFRPPFEVAKMKEAFEAIAAAY